MSHLVVSHLVVVEVAGSCKSLSANPTLMWLFPAVNSPETGASALLFLYVESYLRLGPPMCVEARARGEAFVANIANMWLLSCVGSHVPLQKAGAVKRLSTDGARKHGLLPWAPERKQQWNDKSYYHYIYFLTIYIYMIDLLLTFQDHPCGWGEAGREDENCVGSESLAWRRLRGKVGVNGKEEAG